jgi:hypothetical protein
VLGQKSDEGFPFRVYQDPSCTTLAGEAFLSASSSVKEVIMIIMINMLM